MQRLLKGGLWTWVLLVASCSSAPHPMREAAKGNAWLEAGDTAIPGSPSPEASSSAVEKVYTLQEVRAAVEKAHVVLWKGVEGHALHRSCFTCHNHGAPMLAFATARERGFAVPEKEFDDLIAFTTDYLEANRERFLHGHGPGPLSLGGATDTTGWALFALGVAGKRPDATTAAAVEYTLMRDRKSDHWGAWGPSRPPAEKGSFMPTALAIHGLRTFGLPEHQERIAPRVSAGRQWLASTPPADTEDRVFRLIGLKAAGATAEEISRAGTDLVRAQRADGGWAQNETLSSDAYATGSALTALRMGAEISADDPVYIRGVAYLIRTQQEDGSWHVRSRSFPFQPYYESGFPHGKDQFISSAATGWAATALALACPRR